MLNFLAGVKLPAGDHLFRLTDEFTEFFFHNPILFILPCFADPFELQAKYREERDKTPSEFGQTAFSSFMRGKREAPAKTQSRWRVCWMIRMKKRFCFDVSPKFGIDPDTSAVHLNTGRTGAHIS